MIFFWKNLKIFAKDKFPGIENEPGIFFLRWKNNKNPVTINRLGGSDRNGILYVGESKKLRTRLQRIWRGITTIKIPKNKSSQTLRRTIIFCKLHEEISSEEYEIACQHLSTKIEAQVQKAAALKIYTEKFKELPPLNLRLCTEKYGIWGFGYFDQSKWVAEPNEFVKSILN
jgi:hypothetical protein